MKRYMDYMDALMEHIKKQFRGVETMGLEELNAFYFNDLLEANYATSFSNPDYCETCYGEGLGRILAAVSYELRKGIFYAYHPQLSLSKQLVEEIQLFVERLRHSDFEYQILHSIFRLYLRRVTPLQNQLKLYCEIEESPFQAILVNSDLNCPDFLYQYGYYVSETEIQMLDFLNQYTHEKLIEIANTIVDAFFHGFLSQGRTKRDRKTVQVSYSMGFEPLALQVVNVFMARGMSPIISAVHPIEGFKKYHLDHREDLSILFDSMTIQNHWMTFESSLKAYYTSLKDVCGMVGIDTFGQVVHSPVKANAAYQFSGVQREQYKKSQQQQSTLLETYIRPDDISFCKIAFPNPSIGSQFTTLFDAFVDINLADSQVFEAYQQMLINVLDQGVCVKVIGQNGNKTNMLVSLRPISRPDKETNFMNCGGDLNIPHGEVFTTPLLTGTSGLLHFKDLNVRGSHYKNLELLVENGMVINYSCKNFESEAENKKYVFENLLNSNENITIGEFAIGTNTEAYAVIKGFNVVENLPILLVEKLGPHFALGDPCYAGGEDAHLYNLLDGKEIVAKENERTAQRNQQTSVYFGMHADLTIPYEDILELSVENGMNTVVIIRDGLFAVEGLEPLNKPLLTLYHNQMKMGDKNEF